MNETFNERTAKRMQQELDEFHADQRALAQAQLDNWWQARLDAQRGDGMTEVAGFRERRRASCHIGKTDSDYGQH